MGTGLVRDGWPVEVIGWSWEEWLAAEDMQVVRVADAWTRSRYGRQGLLAMQMGVSQATLCRLLGLLDDELGISDVSRREAIVGKLVRSERLTGFRLRAALAFGASGGKVGPFADPAVREENARRMPWRMTEAEGRAANAHRMRALEEFVRVFGEAVELAGEAKGAEVSAPG